MFDSDLTGQIGLVVKAVGFWPRVIAHVTASPAHHVIIHVGAGQCISAEPGGTRLRPVRDFPGAVWSRFPFTRKQRLSIAFWARNRYGRPYNYAAFVAIGVALMMKRDTPAWVERFLMTDRSYECAQLADAALMHAGVHVFRDGRPYGAVYPGSFVRVWEQFGWWPDGSA